MSDTPPLDKLADYCVMMEPQGTVVVTLRITDLDAARQWIAFLAARRKKSRQGDLAGIFPSQP